MGRFIPLSCLSAFILISGLLSGCSRFASSPREDLEFGRYLDRRVPELMEEYRVPGVSLAIIKGNRILLVRSYGMASDKSRLSVDAPCRVESISKSVTAWGVMKLVEEGRLALDDPAKKYLKSWEFPASPFDAEKITIRQLLSHTSGLPLGTIGVRYDPSGPVPSLRDALSRDAIMQQPAGTSFSYSNTGFNLLELIIEEVTGRPFADYMREEILLPLGMNHSNFAWKEWEVPVPDGHGYQGNSIGPYVYPEKASGGLFATVEDVARFAQASRGISGEANPVLQPSSLKHMYSLQTRIPGLYGMVFQGYGLGHFLEELSGPTGQHRSIAHGGQGSGWMTHFQVVPATGDGIVILTNSQRSWPLFSAILTDWAAWNGYESIGMGLIARLQPYLRALIAVLLALSLWLLWPLVRGLSGGFPYFLAPLSWAPMLRLLLAFLIFGLLLYIQSQPYFFLASVFPVLTPYLGYALFFLAIVLLTTALLRPNPGASEP